MSPDAEVMAVRSDEQLDLARLEPWLRANLPDTAGALTLQQVGGGHANLTYLLRFGDTEYVLRRPPLGPIAPTAHDMRREHRVLVRLRAACDRVYTRAQEASDAEFADKITARASVSRSGTRAAPRHAPTVPENRAAARYRTSGSRSP